VLKKAGAGLET